MYMDKTLKLILITTSIILIGYYLIFHILSGLGSEFRSDCLSVKVGMTRSDIAEIMSEYQNNDQYRFTDTEKELSYSTEGFSGYYQCYIRFDDEGKVSSVLDIFD